MNKTKTLKIRKSIYFALAIFRYYFPRALQNRSFAQTQALIFGKIPTFAKPSSIK